ncbi:PREDICTED: trihelix transcription factor ASIL1-like [Tarenaya hassleriana]|uniref:trihelix transcription factor ASIL1-like n=1 Tax=Tarenaya hassleriana TaxID=28532 RepID=UPI00053C2663|nr:PREDICTED: trihelix transcription factor ASIL1-like [Tarenaya hassleriana]
MDESEDDARYSKKLYSLNRQKHPMYSRPIPKRHAYYREEEGDDEEEEGNELNEYPEQDDGEDGVPQGYNNRKLGSSEGLQRFPKRQKQIKSVYGYEFAGPSDAKLAHQWTEHEAFVLLEVWGDRFLQLGRRSLRNEDWNEVAEKVSEELRGEKSETLCRSMMDELKRKYKKEKAKLEKSGSGSTKWVFFNKLDMLLGSSPRSDSGLACGLDSGEFVFMSARVYLDKSNRFDEMMDSPGASETGDEEEEEDDDDTEDRGRKVIDSGSYRLLADSVQSLGKIYERIENSKRKHMRDLEKMRADFQRELELQKKQILERSQAEIAKISEEGDDEDDDDEDHNDNDCEMDEDSFANLSE